MALDELIKYMGNSIAGAAERWEKGGRNDVWKGGGDFMARPGWIPKDVWRLIKHGKRPKFIPKEVWKMLKEGVRIKATEEAVKLLAKLIKLIK